MSPGATFERVYKELKGRLRAGAYPPGDPLEPALLGESLNASVTPVRDALHRLVGERLAAVSRTGGFQVPLLMEADLRDLYQWNAMLAALAIGAARGGTPASGMEAANDPQGDDEAFFLMLARRAERPELLEAVRSLGDRLAPIRRAEHGVLPDRSAEIAAMRRALVSGATGELRRQLGKYHRLRARRVSDILVALGASSSHGAS